MTDVRNMTAADAGTWLDGWHGWTNGYRAVERAIEWGWTVPEEYAEGWADFRENHYGDHDTWHDLNGDDGAFVDKATDYLQEIAPENYVFRWDDGLTLLTVWADCAADGGGCDVDMDSNGREIVKPCREHNPCEGHNGEDADLTNPEVGMGETTYCDGSCARLG
jgi:hypothetical protein